jgi:sugar (pentulose or hexulose) kinase
MADANDAERSDAARAALDSGETALGIELGSTRIKAVLIGPGGAPLATGSHEWSNQFVDGLWTYDLKDVWTGLQACYVELAADVEGRYGVALSTVGALGVSAMMHGYLAFDRDGELLAPFRTWRNSNTDAASSELTTLFGHNIPHRWSIAHIYQAVLNGEEHVGRVAHLTTLAGYVHDRLSGEKVLGVGDASGMFPIDLTTGKFDRAMVAQFDDLPRVREQPWKLDDVLPAIAVAGDGAGRLTDDGARLLDPSGTLRAGVPMCPPEGDAGTGMVATNSIAPRTGNVSAGTSIFAMVVLEHALGAAHREIDLVTTPVGDLVAMVHCNNGTSDLDSWVGLFAEFARSAGVELDTTTVYGTLYTKALEGDADGGGLLAYNYLSGEPIASLEHGRPLFVRTPDSRMSLANFMRTHLLATLATLREGMDLLVDRENVALDSMYAHGGLFKTAGVGQRLLAAAIRTPVSVGEIAGEGGAWGMALLADFLRDERHDRLSDYLASEIFQKAEITTSTPQPDDVSGFDAYMERHRRGLDIERAAIQALA